jgi:surface protein
MFYQSASFCQDIGAWNVGRVTNMKAMFAESSRFNVNIGSWDVSNVKNMQGMFCNARSFNQNIGAWNVANVTNMQGMFCGANMFRQDIARGMSHGRTRVKSSLQQLAFIHWMKMIMEMIMKMTMFYFMIMKLIQMIFGMFDDTNSSYCLICHYPTNFYNINNIGIVSVLYRYY